MNGRPTSAPTWDPTSERVKKLQLEEEDGAKWVWGLIAGWEGGGSLAAVLALDWLKRERECVVAVGGWAAKRGGDGEEGGGLGFGVG
ncbi:hypothetical protein Pyn_37381 [Prunus yedoensis var. nudiflora]|uniref:Uncharacterized protein n=1 Tax=Prunus yedoensis var. nudiflora TaxID=2094558 RepID=A0A314YQG1_PRUYE|nr:hypothetical protein Pyn_37381 [Prunus yedoensis var. nudiflora]